MLSRVLFPEDIRSQNLVFVALVRTTTQKLERGRNCNTCSRSKSWNSCFFSSFSVKKSPPAGRRRRSVSRLLLISLSLFLFCFLKQTHQNSFFSFVGCSFSLLVEKKVRPFFYARSVLRHKFFNKKRSFFQFTRFCGKKRVLLCYKITAQINSTKVCIYKHIITFTGR